MLCLPADIITYPKVVNLRLLFTHRPEKGAAECPAAGPFTRQFDADNPLTYHDR